MNFPINRNTFDIIGRYKDTLLINENMARDGSESSSAPLLSPDSTGKEGDGGVSQHPTMDGTSPITDLDSKRVMLRGERGDYILISNIEQTFDVEWDWPGEMEVIRRESTYYGPELELRTEEKERFLLTAPGPGSYLHLWAPQYDSKDRITSWEVLAEVRATFSSEMPNYCICNRCGEPIRSLEHERMSILGKCS